MNVSIQISQSFAHHIEGGVATHNVAPVLKIKLPPPMACLATKQEAYCSPPLLLHLATKPLA